MDKQLGGWFSTRCWCDVVGAVRKRLFQWFPNSWKVWRVVCWRIETRLEFLKIFEKCDEFGFVCVANIVKYAWNYFEEMNSCEVEMDIEKDA